MFNEFMVSQMLKEREKEIEQQAEINRLLRESKDEFGQPNAASSCPTSPGQRSSILGRLKKYWRVRQYGSKLEAGVRAPMISNRF